MASPLDPFVVGVILTMSVVTYATKAGGLWLLGRVDVPARVETGLELLPGAIIVSILAPELVAAGPPEWGAGAVVVAVMWRSGNVLLSLLGGVGAVLLLRTIA
jgi:uncharacterized membrane protein